MNMKRFERQIMLREIGVEGQAALANASVLIVGAGGPGSPAALFLAAGGIGRIGVAHGGWGAVSNLQRQGLFSGGGGGKKRRGGGGGERGKKGRGEKREEKEGKGGEGGERGEGGKKGGKGKRKGGGGREKGREGGGERGKEEKEEGERGGGKEEGGKEGEGKKVPPYKKTKFI